MTITNYDTLVQAIQEEAENDGAEFLSFIPTAIDMAEEKLFKELDLPELEEEVTGNMTSSNNQIPKPTGYKFGDAVTIMNGTSKVILKKKFASFLDDYWPDTSVTATPKYYADKDQTSFSVAPTPDVSYGYTIRCTKEPAKLSTLTQTNYYTNECQDILFYACMEQMAKFMKAWNQVAVWSQSYSTAQQGWNMQAMRYRRDGQITPNSPDEGPNSLKHTITSQA